MVMNREPYRSADRVFWMVDNGSSHGGPKTVARLRERWPRLVLVHLPIHAGWLNQIEIYFSNVQRKALTPYENSMLQDLAMRIMRFQQRFEEIANPFEWKFTRHDLNQLMGRLFQRSAPFTRSE